MALSTYEPKLLDVPPADLDSCSMELGNQLLVDWAHSLGPMDRPFTERAYVLHVDGAPVSVAMSASTVSATAAGFKRKQLVELARLCSAPGEQWANRVMLRLWRVVLGPRWPDWRPLAAVSYSQNARHGGDLYRFDGWRKVATDAGDSAGGGNRRAQHAGKSPRAGAKTLWVWVYG